ncbi:hypothetical protein HYH02_007846 [Chlamydomonas schloesseri]|uniref:Uncharacterized protein n=1 Tax=Chlamydomonas schloesseri TaxID=2026947 RepID=A0A836B467_9CHLO|nr:hypothetical protein HYH02_007846 [Chlamydomonas schloesseri]|eukprot:KAG2447097.1 hypothetical protein HYH02_007846 [Chlamydomonas schloesseri]
MTEEATDAERIRVLEKKLRLVEAERDDLSADVERLCLQLGRGKLDDASERAYNAEAAARKAQLQLADANSERDAAHAALAIAGEERAELSEALGQVRRQLEASQASEAQLRVALADSQQACEGLSGQARGLQEKLDAARGELKEGLVAREALQSQVAALQAQLQALQAEAEAQRKQAEARDQAGSKELVKLRKTVAQLEEAANQTRTQLAEVQAEAMHTHKLLKQAHKIEDQLSTQVQQLQASLAAAKQGQQPTTPCKSGESMSEAASPQPAQPVAVSPPAGPAAGSPAPSPRSAAARSLTAVSTAAVTVTVEEAVRPHAADLAAPAAAAASDAVGAAPAAGPSDTDALTSSEAAAEAVKAEAASATAALAAAQLRVKTLEVQLAEAREELELERAGQSDEREQLQVLRTMVHEFKIKLAQATQEKVEALMRAASVTQEAQQQLQQLQMQQAAAAGGASGGGGAAAAGGGGGGAGGVASSSSIPILQRIGSTLSASARERSEAAAAAQHSRRASRDVGILSRSPSTANAQGQPGTMPSPVGGSGNRSLWATWLGSGGGSFSKSTPAAETGAAAAGSGALPPTSSGGGATAASPRAAAAASPGTLPPQHPPAGHAHAQGSNYAASVASEESADLDASASLAATASAAAASVAAHAATVEAAEGRNRRLAAQLERVRAQLAAVDRLAAAVGRCLGQLEGAAGLLWSSREEDAPRRWAALRDLTKLAEACAAMRSEAGLPPPVAPAAAPAGVASAVAAPAAQPQPEPGAGAAGGGGGGVAVGGDSGGENDASVVCTRESGGVQRRVAEVLMGAVEFGVRSLEAYNHAAALSSVTSYG